VLRNKSKSKPRTCADTLVQHKQRKRDVTFGMWNVRSLYRAGSLKWDVGMGTGSGLAQDRYNWQALVTVVMNLRVPKKCGIFLD